MTDIVERARNRSTPYGWLALVDEMAAEIERLRALLAETVPGAAREAEIERLQALKTPASRELLNITKAALDHAEAEIERLSAPISER